MANIFVLHNGSGSRFYRLVPQLKQLQELGHKVIMEPNDAEDVLSKIQWSDIVIFQMVFSKPLIKFAKKAGKKVIFECDDLIHVVPKDHYSYSDVKGIKKYQWLCRIFTTLRDCDLFICTTDELRKRYGWMAKRSFVFNNYCDLPHWLKEYKPNTTDRIRILWAGSTSHTPDLKMIQPTIKRILEKYPKVQFMYIGHGGIKGDDIFAKFIYGDDLFSDLPKERREAMLSYPANVWPYILASLQADIAIAPLEKNYFNKHKSTCKYLEYSVNKIPAVYSKWFYGDTVGKNGLLADTPDEWFSCLSELIENAILRKELGENAFKDVLQRHDMRQHIIKWTDAIDRVLK